MNDPASKTPQESAEKDKPKPAPRDYSKLYTPEGWCAKCWHKWGRALTKGMCRCVTGP